MTGFVLAALIKRPTPNARAKNSARAQKKGSAIAEHTKKSRFPTMSELWEREFGTTSYECCTECGNAIYNGESYYEIDGMIICEVCMNNFYKRIMDYDEYTYQDYLTEKYESKRHDD